MSFRTRLENLERGQPPGGLPEVCWENFFCGGDLSKIKPDKLGLEGWKRMFFPPRRNPEDCPIERAIRESGIPEDCSPPPISEEATS
jgi:hypothetical protein